MITFKQFLIEGGNATAKWNTERANQADIKAALEFVSKTLGVPYNTLKNDLLGSTALTLLGKKKDSGDIDIAFSIKDANTESIDEKMRTATNGEGGYNKGTRVGSYAVPVNGKKVQVDLMFVDDKDWAKFMYHSSLGNGSKYPGAVRNILMFTALTKRQVPGEDFVLRDNDGNVLARASRSIKMDTGMERLFKVAKKTKAGDYSKTLEKVGPEDVKTFLKELGKEVKFKGDPDITSDPATVVQFIFGKGTKPEDVKTAEQVIALIKKQKDAAEILKAGKAELERLKMVVPEEMNQ
jgi:hypothetical protein